ncbi:AP-4 complex subunit mu-1, partial [Neopsephotus bourkii]|uniref:AP-4 complex subunit mu-1 n=1 Tax=Neopsephotus bourkii TaxID=309878 RepID=UPI002AA5AEEB
MLSQLFILSSKGDRLLHRDFRGDPLDPITDVADVFYRGVTALPGDQAPVFMALGGLHFVHVRHSGLYFVATTRAEASPFTLLEFLNRLVALLRDFCGPLSEQNLGGNLALAAELLEEMLDYGYIQSTAPELLRSLTQSPPVSPPPFSLLDLGSIGLFGADTQRSKVAPGSAATRPLGAPRGEQGEELFVDVLERLTVVLGSNGTPLKVDVQGEMRLKCYIPNCRELRLGLSEEFCVGKAELRGYGTQVRVDDVSFHPCVNLEEFEAQRVLRVTPPQGEVTLMRYQLLDDVPTPLPFRLYPHMEWDPMGRLRLHLKLRCDLPPNSHAINIHLELPIPKGVTSVAQELSSPDQRAEAPPGSHCIQWDIPKCRGGAQVGAIFKLWSPLPLRALGPVAARFELPAQSCSGLRLRFLRLAEGAGPGAGRGSSAPPPPRWLRYVTHSDSYVMRMED